MSRLPETQAATVGGSVHVRAYSRTEDGKTVAVSEHDRRAPDGRGDADDGQTAQADKPSPGTDCKEFRDAIAKAEGSFTYGAKNESGEYAALGRYQLRRAVLQEAGWQDADGNWTDKARQAGVKSEAEFLRNREAQDQAMTDVMAAIKRQADTTPDNKGKRPNIRLSDSIGKEFVGKEGGIKVTEAGLHAAIHRRGASAVREYFARFYALGNQSPVVKSGISGVTPDSEIETRLREFQNVKCPPAKSPGTG